MSEAIAKPTPKKAAHRAKAKKQPSTVKTDPFELSDRETGFEAVHNALEELRDFVQSIDTWEAEDCLQALANLGLVQRFATRVDGGHNYVMLDADNPLDRALNKLLGPLT